MKTSSNVYRLSGLAVALFALLTSYSHAITLDYWRFEESEGTPPSATPALDSAGPNPGTLQDPYSSRSTTVFGNPVPKTGAANTQSVFFSDPILLDGGAVDMGFSPDRGIGDFTIEAWINRVGDNPDGFAVIAGKFPSGDFGDTGWALFARAIPEATTHYEVALAARLDGGPFRVAATGTGAGSTNFFLDMNTWYHVAAVRAAGQFRVYVDGILHGTAAAPATEDYTEPLQKFSIGGSRGGGVGTFTGNFYGYIDEVRLSDTALNPDKFLNGPLDTGTDGDYNNNGVVDAGDYVVWRKGGTLAHDPNPGNPAAQYSLWRANFGKPNSGAGLSGGAVPEPTSAVLVVLACLSVVCGRHFRF
jgi:concanavalin A-like lectin/glucanase superfamily protein